MVNKKLIFRIVFLIFLSFPFFLLAESDQEINSQLPQNDDTIEEFTSLIKINSDSSITIEEKIVYNFQSKNKHGITRIIPTQYQIQRPANQNEQNTIQNLDYALYIEEITIKDENGQSHPFEQKTHSNNIEIKIGEPLTEVSGIKTYIIHYTVWGAISLLEDVDNLFWNINSSFWKEPIKHLKAEIILPQQYEKESLKQACFLKGKKDQGNTCQATLQNSTVTFQIEDNISLKAKESVSIALDWPKGSISKVEPKTKTTHPFAQYKKQIIIFCFIYLLFSLFFVIFIKRNNILHHF